MVEDRFGRIKFRLLALGYVIVIVVLAFATVLAHYTSDNIAGWVAGRIR